MIEIILSTRLTAIYDLPLPADVVILNPESAILRFPNGKSTDFGAICYLHREAAPEHFYNSRKQSDGRKVDLSSFSSARAKRVLELITHISEDLKHSGKRTETVRDYTTRFVAFMFWADTNGFNEVLDNAGAARTAVQAYARHLRERVMTNAISINSAARQQSATFGLLERFLDVDDLTRGVNLLRKRPAAREVTIPPNQDSQARILGLCEVLFNDLSTFVLENKQYPHYIALPEYLNYPNNVLWIFPTTTWFAPRNTILNGDMKWSQGYNYREGRLATVPELLASENFTQSKHAAYNIINKAKSQLDTANDNKDHNQRQRLGMIALNAFIVLFLAQTGMNWAQIVNMAWSKEYDIDSTHQIFRTIKWRADNRNVAFELPVSFMPKFKRYLELRAYILKNNYCEWLFFKFESNDKNCPTRIIANGLGNIYRTLLRIDPSLPKVTPRQWRAAKSDWLIRNTDLSTTALILQNTEKTVLSYYASGSEALHAEEMTDFLGRLTEAVIQKGQVIEGGVDRAVGYCSSYGFPKQTNEQLLITPECTRLEGCFFCDKYRVHADEKDVRKLISCRHSLRLTMALEENEESFQTRLDPIFKKIEELLSEISRMDNNLVLKITTEVEEMGELDPYWARKLEMLMELGLIA